MQMVLNVYLSRSVDIPDNDRDKVYDFIDREIRNEYENIHDDDVIQVSSTIDDPPAPPVTLRPKLHHLELAFNKMKDCDIFFLLTGENDEIKPESLIEMNAWLYSKGEQPIIRNKIV